MKGENLKGTMEIKSMNKRRRLEHNVQKEGNTFESMRYQSILINIYRVIKKECSKISHQDDYISTTIV